MEIDWIVVIQFLEDCIRVGHADNLNARPPFEQHFAVQAAKALASARKLDAPELDAAADWYEQMIEERDPFALLYARTPTVEPLREHHRWPRLAALMRLPPVPTTT